jgi:hypothetical protein
MGHRISLPVHSYCYKCVNAVRDYFRELVQLHEVLKAIPSKALHAGHSKEICNIKAFTGTDPVA